MKWMMLMLLVLLAGCATASMPISPSVATAKPGTHLVTVEYQKSWVPVAAQPIGIFVDGAIVSILKSGHAVNLHLEDGRHMIGVGFSGSALHKARMNQEIAVDVSPTSQPIIRGHYVAAGWGGFKIEQLHAD
jgi:hypothetical protein